MTRRLRQYREKVEKLVWMWENMDGSKKYARTEAGGWSLTEILVHLELVQKECLRSVHERLESGIKKPSSWKYTRRFILLRLAMKSKRKFKAPGMVQPPADNAQIESWTPEGWLKSWDELESLFLNLPATYNNILLFRHPVAGPLKAKHALIFLVDHLDHHFREIKMFAH